MFTKYLVGCMLLWLTVCSVPTCQVLQTPNQSLYLTAAETQAISLSKYIQGYNLNYSLEGDVGQSFIQKPFVLDDTEVMPLIPEGSSVVTLGYKMVDVDILADSDKAWSKQGAVLLNNNDSNGFMVIFGNLNSKSNLHFTGNISYTHSQPCKCYDIVLVGYNQAIIDCQFTGGNNRDIVYFINSTDIWPFTFDAKAKVVGSQRKSIRYFSGSNEYVLVASIADTFDQASRNKSFITVYNIDKNNSVVTQEGIINNASLAIKALTMSDISVDTSGNIYVSDLLLGVYKFRYTGGLVQAKSMLSKVGIIKMDVVNDEHVYIASVTSITQVQWLVDARIVRSFDLADFSRVVLGLGANSKTIVVRTSSKYYFYKVGDTNYQHIIAQIINNDTRMAVQGSSGQILIVGVQSSQSYQVYEPTLYVKSPGQITIKATSQANLVSADCNQTFSVSTVTDSQKQNVFVKSSLPVVQTLESPADINLEMNQHFQGVRLQYSISADGKATVEKKHINNHTVKGNSIFQVELLGSYSINLQNYLRVSKKNDVVTSQLCQNSKGSSQTNCMIKKSFKASGLITCYSIFKTVFKGEQLEVVALVESMYPSTIRFEALNGNLIVIPSLNVGETISHISSNGHYLFVTIKDLSQISVYKADLSLYEKVGQISSSTFTPEQISQILRFKPRMTKIAQNSQYLFIKNLESIIIVRMAGSSVSWVANIPVEGASNPNLVWDYKIQPRSLVISSWATNTAFKLLEYDLNNMNNVLFLKDLNLLQEKSADVIQFQGNQESTIVAVRVHGIDRDVIKIYRTGTSALSTPYYSFGMPEKVPFYIAQDEQSVILETADPSVHPVKIYEQPKIKIRVQSNSDTFKIAVPYTVRAKSFNEEKSINSSLNVYSFQTNIVERQNANSRLSLPKTASNVKVQLILDDLFNGSITNYQLRCQKCQGKIKLIGHLTRQARLAYEFDVNAIYNFKEFNNTVTILTDKSVLYFFADTYRGRTDINIPDISCKRLEIINSTLLVAYCQTPEKQWFVPIKVPTFDKTVAMDPIAIAPQYYVNNCLKLKYVNGQLLLLDNDILGKGRGVVHLFSISLDDTISIKWVNMLTSFSFGSTLNTTITDIQVTDNIVATVLLVTLTDVGIGYMSLVESEWVEPGYLNLATADKVQKFVLEGNKYLQVLVIDDKGTDFTTVKMGLVVTMTRGTHLYLTVMFNKKESGGLEVSNFLVTSSFSKYGPLTVMNWASFVFEETIIGWLAIPYLDEDRKLVTVALYQLPSGLSNTITFKASISRTVSGLYNFDCVLFRSGSAQDSRLISFGADQNKSVLSYVLSSRTYLQLDYDPHPDIQNITIMAGNDYKLATHKIDVDFGGSTDGSLGWYLYALIALGGIFVLGLIYGLFKFIKRKNKESKKLSLLNEDEEV